ncbi:MAG: LOG family protein [Myxococcota bacterium]|nr:LOG family protein [Myxococcota bacterium]
MNPEKAYKDLAFLNSPEARAIRILCEYEEPKKRFREQRVSDTIVFFGSARALPRDVLADQVANLKREIARDNSAERKIELEAEQKRLDKAARLSEYYEKTRELARLMTEWDMNRMGSKRYFVSTGGGPGIMEAANRGASEVPGGRSVGLGISLPFEAGCNPYVTPELAFEFHYFFTRKYWFLYLCKAMVICPGGFGTMDELFESLTLRQTGKITKPMPTVLFGTEYWSQVFNFQALVDWGTISPEDVNLFMITDSVEEAFDFLCNELVLIEQDTD